MERHNESYPAKSAWLHPVSYPCVIVSMVKTTILSMYVSLRAVATQYIGMPHPKMDSVIKLYYALHDDISRTTSALDLITGLKLLSKLPSGN